MENDRKKRARQILTIESSAIEGVREKIAEGFDKAIDLILASKGKVVITGMGKSGLIGRKIASTMASTGTPAFFLHPADGIHGDLGMVRRGDVVIALSNSGETEEIVRLLSVFQRIGLPVIAMTGRPESTLAKYADAVLDVGVQKEACSLGLAPTASTTATLAVGDALAVVLFEEKGFSEENFADLHPGGALGRRLQTVADLMHSGDDIPIVPLDIPLTDALHIISAKRLGVTGVVDNEGNLVGVITDGDIRRMTQAGVDLYKAKVGEVMSRSPKRLSATELAAAALRKMEEHTITSLFVFESASSTKPVGIVHIHDLLKAGVG